MNKEINISQTQIVLAFAATCIEATARTLGVSYREVFLRMKRLGMIENYIFPNYIVLHTESRENLALDMIECMKLWEERLLTDNRPAKQLLEETCLKPLKQLDPSLQELCGICHVDESDLNGDKARGYIVANK